MSSEARHVQSEAERKIVLPHLSCHIVPPSQLIGKKISVCIEDKTNNSVKRFCREELDFDIEVVDPTVTETLLRGTRGISDVSCSTPQTVLSTTRERNQ